MHICTPIDETSARGHLLTAEAEHGILILHGQIKSMRKEVLALLSMLPTGNPAVNPTPNLIVHPSSSFPRA